MTSDNGMVMHLNSPDRSQKSKKHRILSSKQFAFNKLSKFASTLDVQVFLSHFSASRSFSVLCICDKSQTELFIDGRPRVTGNDSRFSLLDHGTAHEQMHGLWCTKPTNAGKGELRTRNCGRRQLLFAF